MRLYFIIFFFYFTGYSIKANDSIPKQKSYGLIIGYQRASGNYIEFGISKEISFISNPVLVFYSAHPTRKSISIIGHRYFSLNMNYNPSNNMFGYSVGYNSGGLIAYGLNANYYNFSSDYRIGLKPEIGIIINRFLLFYGYNIKLAGKENGILSRNSIRFCCYFPILGKMNTKTFEIIKKKSRKGK